MLELRPNCENCGKIFAPDSQEAMICTFECTFCSTCVDAILHNVCPNCGGGFVKRPVRPKGHLEKYPPSDKQVLKPVDMDKFQALLSKNKNISPHER